MPDFLKGSAGVSGAINPTYNIGEIDESKMDYREIINEVVTNYGATHQPIQYRKNNNKITLYPNPIKPNTFIDFLLPDSYSGKKAQIEIQNIKGVLIKKMSAKVLGIRNRVLWDGKDTAGKPISPGKHIITIKVGGDSFRESAVMLK